MDVYIRKVLRVSVAQICQTIGYNSFQSIPLELLVDSLQKFLQEFARDLHLHVELFNRTEANLDDVALTLQSLSISTGDLLEYINNVQPVSCNIEIPELPAKKSSNLNFLKPGSKEVLTRPVHIYEHLPPILRDAEQEKEEDKSNIVLASPNAGQLNTNLGTISNEQGDEIDRKISTEQLALLIESKPPLTIGELNNPNQPQIDVTSKSAMPSSATREISSVMMTSGGFISPAMEGKTPESVIPDIVEKYFGLDAPPTSPPPPPPVSAQIQPDAETTKPLINTNSIHSPLINQNQDQKLPPKTSKASQNSDKKKKMKKKALGNVPTNTLGMPPNMFADKAQRKRFRMLQKSMAKNSSTGSMGNLKSKNHSTLSQSQQEKLLKKQLKLKQKQMRQQSIQKQTEAALTATVPNIFRGNMDKAPIPPHPHDLDKIKPKKEPSAAVSILPEDGQPQPDAEIANSSLGPPSFSSNSKAIHQQPMSAAGAPDTKAIPPLMPMAHSIGGTVPPLSMQSDEVKLNNEPDRSKLNIFKKISSSGRKERTDGPPIQHPELKSLAASSGGTTIFGDSQVISLPSGTTITPAPPSGSGRHVYAPPPSSSQQSGDFNSVISVDDSNGIPEGSAVLMQRGDLMIQKPKKRGRKPGSKNQPKILGMTTTKKPKKMKKSSFFGHHSSSNLMEPLNLSHNSIDNLANIPLGIASTFPIDGGVSSKMKKERKKSKLGKESGFMHNHSKSSLIPLGARNMAPTKEEFGTINQKLMMMNTVLQPAPPLPSGGPGGNSNMSSMPGKSGNRSSTSPSFSPGSIPIDVDSAVRAKKERKKQQKQMKDQQKQAMQQQSGVHHHQFGSHQAANQPTASSGRSSSPYPAPSQSFSTSGIPGMDGMPMFPFYPFPARPGLIPSHNLFSQLPNMHNNSLFMPPLMGFPTLNHSIRPFFKDEKNTNSTPMPMVAEGNYSKVAPLVPDTMKLELSPGASSSKTKTTTISPRGMGQPLHSNSEPMSSLLSPGHVGVIRKKSDDHHNASLSMANALKNNSETIEVSSDDSQQDEIRKQSTTTPTFANRPAVPLTGVPSGLYRQSRPPVTSNNSMDMNIVNCDVDRSSSTERRNKEHKKVKKINKQGKKQSPSSAGASGEMKSTMRHDFLSGSTDAINMTTESGRKSEDSAANSSGTIAMDYESSPEKRKDHKKMKKLLKETKIKKKKDKKDKNKNKEKNPEKIIKTDKSEKEKRKEEKKDKDKLKKLKKDKKKSKEDKERNDDETHAVAGGPVKFPHSGTDGLGSVTEGTSGIPKITLKLGQSVQSPTTSLKAGPKSSLLSSGGYGLSEREQSPELARISPLVTRPPKQHKSGTEDLANSLSGMAPAAGTGAFQHTPSLSASLNILNDSVIDIDSNSGGPSTFMLPASATILGGLGLPQTSSTKPPANTSSSSSLFHSSGGSSGGLQHATSSSSSTSSNKHSLSSSLMSEANRPTSYVDTSTKDAEGNRVWICPACGKVDDGSPMIGCDGCDAWYHWVCVGILVAPDDNEDWYCRVCIAKKRGVHGGDKKRKRNKKKNNSDF